MDLHVDLTVSWILGDLECLRPCHQVERKHVVLHEVADVAKVVKVLEEDVKVGTSNHVGRKDALTKKRSGGCISLAESDPNPRKDLVNFCYDTTCVCICGGGREQPRGENAGGTRQPITAAEVSYMVG